MKASRAQIERALDRPADGIRFFLLHGPDESQSRELAARPGKALGADAERIDFTGAALKADPARLADEAAAISLFGGARYIRVEPAGEEIADAIEALLEGPAGGNPVIVIAGALRKDSKLLKRALADPAVMAFASYLPEGQDVDRLAMTIGRDHGLRIDPEMARRLADLTGGDRALLSRELEKLALFLDAAPDRPADLPRDAFEALSAAHAEGDLSRLINAVLLGQGESILAELSRLGHANIEGIAILRPLLRRLMLLAQLRGQVEQGNSVETVMESPSARAVFWKEKAIVARQLSRWTAAMLDRAIGRLMAAERAVKASGSIGPLGVEAELIAICRVAARQA